MNRMRNRLGVLALLAALGLVFGLVPAARPVLGDEPPAPTAEPEAERLGDEICLECHGQYASAWTSLRHNQYLHSERLPERLRGCEGCHGPGSAHLEDPDFRAIRNAQRMTGLAAVEACLECHRGQIKAADWLAHPHADAGMNCGTCHEVHQDAGGLHQLRRPQSELCLSCHEDKRAELHLNSHHPVLEERMDCSDCHNPHGAEATYHDLLKAGDDRCLRCHMDKRGPFVFEHQTEVGDGDESCLSCHRSHGSSNPKLLKFFGRATCLQCHADIAADAAHRPRTQTCWAAGCHNQVHGSNTNRLLIN